MRKDQIFVLLLIVILPLSGCVDGTIGDADAQDATEESSTTVVNNYYYNNTSVVNSSSQIEYKYLVFDTELENGQWPNTINPNNGNYDHILLGSFNTTGGMLYSVVYNAQTCETTNGWNSYQDCYVALKSTCGDVVFANQYYGNAVSETTAIMLRGTVANICVHEVYSYTNEDGVNSINAIRMHYEIGLKEIPATPF
jgi:hypothetical protein